MKNKILTLSIIILLTLTTVFVNYAPVKAATGDGQWITKYTITDSTTGNQLITKDLVAGTSSGNGEISNGEELTVTVTIHVATSNPSSTLTLSTSMAHSSSLDHYWAHDSSDGYTFGQVIILILPAFSFNRVAGT